MLKLPMKLRSLKKDMKIERFRHEPSTAGFVSSGCCAGKILGKTNNKLEAKVSLLRVMKACLAIWCHKNYIFVNFAIIS